MSGRSVEVWAKIVDGEVELHPLAIENADEGSQRPRLVQYRDHSLLHALVLESLDALVQVFRGPRFRS